MNFSPELSTPVAISMALLAAFMWGSWFVALKYLGDYPLDGFYITLFTTSFVLVWGVALVLDGRALFTNLRDVWNVQPSRIWLTLLCGALYVFGMRLSLWVMKTIGLSLAQPIQSSINVLVGTAVAAFVGGVPKDLSLSRLGIAVACLLAAVLISMQAGRDRLRSQQENLLQSTLRFSGEELWAALGVLLLASLFTPAYTFALSYGLVSVTQPNGMAVLPFMTMLVTGAYAGSWIASGSQLTKNRQWGRVFSAPWSIHKWGVLAGTAHYGGNIIHTFATAQLSSAVSWPLGITGGLWTQFWGLVYGEFKGASRRTYVLLFSGIALYILGVYFVATA